MWYFQKEVIANLKEADDWYIIACLRGVHVQ